MIDDQVDELEKLYAEIEEKWDELRIYVQCSDRDVKQGRLHWWPAYSSRRTFRYVNQLSSQLVELSLKYQKLRRKLEKDGKKISNSRRS